MKTIKTFSISALAMLLVLSSPNYRSEAPKRFESKIATMITSTVVAELSGNEIDVEWDSLPKGNRLEVSVNGVDKSFFNAEGQIMDIPALPGENVIEFSEIQHWKIS